MFNLVSGLIAPAASFAPMPAAPGGPAANPTQRSARRAVPIRDTFALSLAARQAADIGALGRATGNAYAGASLLRVAARGLQAIDAALAKMQALTAKAALTTLSRGERAILNAEFQKLRIEIDRIADQTEFNGIKVLKGATIIEESMETVTYSYSITDLGSRIGVDDGFQDFVIASSPSGVSDGDRIRIEYDKQTGLFTVTNTTTSQVATAAAPATAPPEGQTTDVALSEFSLTIQVNSNFKPNKNNNAPSGSPDQNEFVVSVTGSATTTTVTLRNVTQITFQVGTGTADQDKITLTLPAATVADLDSGLVSDDIDSASGASLALSNVTNAINALKNIQASVDGNAVRFQAAGRNLMLDKTILTDLRTDLLERPITISTADRLANLVSVQFLSHAEPAMAGRISTAMRDLLLSANLQPLEPPEVANRAVAPEDTRNEPDIGFSPYRGETQTSHSGPYKPVDLKA